MAKTIRADLPGATGLVTKVWVRPEDYVKLGDALIDVFVDGTISSIQADEEGMVDAVIVEQDDDIANKQDVCIIRSVADDRIIIARGEPLEHVLDKKLRTLHLKIDRLDRVLDQVVSRAKDDILNSMRQGFDELKAKPPVKRSHKGRKPAAKVG